MRFGVETSLSHPETGEMRLPSSYENVHHRASEERSPLPSLKKLPLKVTRPKKTVASEIGPSLSLTVKPCSTIVSPVPAKG